jgi:hypothetical protein
MESTSRWPTLDQCLSDFPDGVFHPQELGREAAEV